MAGYFSNHSHQSRFLANSPVATSTAATTAATATSTAATTASTASTAHAHILNGASTTHPPAAPSNPTAPAPRIRAPTSRHFSTSLSDDLKSTSALSPHPNGLLGTAMANTVHPLRNTWVFWFRQHRAPGNKIVNYEEGIKKISACSSVESFWSLWTHLNPPSTLLPTTDYLLFHSGVRRPVWEDPLNLSGGKWIIRLKKGVSDRLWEDLVLAVVGDQFDECGPGEEGEGEGDGWPEICGCTISVRQNEDIVTVWNRTEGDGKVKERIQSVIRRALNLSSATTMEYKSNNDSMQDKSSFRVPQANDRTPLS